MRVLLAMETPLRCLVMITTTTGRWKLGFTLGLTSAVLWGVLPIALTIVLETLDPITLTWYRFSVSALALLIGLSVTASVPRIQDFTAGVWRLLCLGLAGMLGNYLLYVGALRYASPTTAQTITQLGPVFLLLGGLIVLHEKFDRRQWKGLGILVGGLALFFNNRLREFSSPVQGLGMGVLMLVVSMLLWATYGMAQKRLQNWIGGQQVLLILYVGATVALFQIGRAHV